MKALILSFAIGMVTLINMPTTQAQDTQERPKKHGAKHQKADSLFQQFSKRLNLTPEQQTKLKEIMKQNRSEMKAIREANKSASKEERRKAVIAQAKKNDERILAILNDSQKQEYAKIKTEFKNKKKANRKPKGDSAPPAEELDELELF
ncbi:MAG: hypothetical protein MUC81_03980 [Bacteroidia bacterium]|jgi:Spy/CpxP family protein refolding chaperone|nr:hypothetical protein [Bacteroidia bacterium]